MWRILSTIVYSPCWGGLLWFWMINSLNINVYICTYRARWFGLPSLSQQIFIRSVALWCVDVWNYELFLVCICYANIEVNVIKGLSHSFWLIRLSIEHTLWRIFPFWLIDNRFTAFASICNMFRLQSWRLSVIGMVQWTFVCFNCPFTVFLNILVSKRHIFYKRWNKQIIQSILLCNYSNIQKESSWYRQ